MNDQDHARLRIALGQLVRHCRVLDEDGVARGRQLVRVPGHPQSPLPRRQRGVAVLARV